MIDRRTRTARGPVPIMMLVATLVAAPVAMATAEEDMLRRSYEGSDAILANPDRGFWFWHTPEASNEGTEPQAPLGAPYPRDAILAERDQLGTTMVKLVYDIRDYRDAPLPPAFLDRVRDDIDAARDMGVKVAPRFTYAWVEDQQIAAARDADADRIVQHLDQLAPILQGGRDVIPVMYAGFVGAWGEWHSSTAGNMTDDSRVNDATRRIYDAIMDAAPDDRFVMLRYPIDRQDLLGPQPFDPADAFGGTDAARTGLHDDAFLQTRYDDVDATPEGRAYRAAIADYTPSTDFLDPNLIDAGIVYGCGEISAALRARGSDFVNDLDGSPRAEPGCSDTLAREVGYRYRMETAALQAETALGGTLAYAFEMANDGMSPTFTERPVVLTLVDGTGSAFDILLDADPRTWLAGETTLVDGVVALPGDLVPGLYDAFLGLPDGYGLGDRPDYAIRLANDGLWDPQTGTHDLGLAVRIGPTAVPLPASGWGAALGLGALLLVRRRAGAGV